MQITSKATREAGGTAAAPIVAINSPTNAVSEITDCKLYAPVVTLSAEEDNELLNQLKSGFKRTIKWNNTCHKCLAKLLIIT